MGDQAASGRAAPVPRLRAYGGPPLFSYGFRPFFLAAGGWALLAMALWLALYLGWLQLPSVFPAVTWHAHELLFGFVAAAVAGFILTAVPNWTGRLPLQGRPLVLLVLLWLAGRLAVAFSAVIEGVAAAIIDVSFLAVLAALVGREIIIGDNRRNRPVLAALVLFAAANAGFHIEVLTGDGAAPWSTRLAIAVVALLVALIGGRIVPSFTRNWLAKRPGEPLPAAFDRLDQATLAALVAAFGVWTVAPTGLPTALLTALAAVLVVVRLGRWRGERTLTEPLLWSLHLGYLWIAVGLALLAAAAVDLLPPLPAWHALTAGAMTAMILAVMTRASLGHTGRPLRATAIDTLIYALAALAAVARVVAGLVPSSLPLLLLSGGLWLAAFALFVGRYAPILLAPRADDGGR